MSYANCRCSLKYVLLDQSILFKLSRCQSNKLFYFDAKNFKLFVSKNDVHVYLKLLIKYIIETCFSFNLKILFFFLFSFKNQM